MVAQLTYNALFEIVRDDFATISETENGGAIL